MSEVHYFPRYSQPENVVTNNTLLLLLRFREFSRFKFEKLLGVICSDREVPLEISWLKFQQQKGTGTSVVDGYIAQESVKIAVETKLTEKFGVDQLKNHLDVFQSEQHKLLILLSPALSGNVGGLLSEVRKHAEPRGIQVVPTTFQKIIEKARECLSPHDEEMMALVDDYEDFCSGMNLLPADGYTLFVPPCGKSFDDNVALRLYYCPAVWNRRNAKYLGIYKDKRVQAIGPIAKIVECNIDLVAGEVTTLTDRGVKPEDVSSEEERRIVSACERALERGWDISTGHKFYICDEMEPTSFEKSSPGGIQGHRYIDLQVALGRSVPESLTELANGLRDKSWPERNGLS